MLINGNIRAFIVGSKREFTGVIGCANAVRIANILILRVFLIWQENK